MFHVNVVEKIKTHVLSSMTFFFETRVVYAIKWKNNLEPDRPQITNGTCVLHVVYQG